MDFDLPSPSQFPSSSQWARASVQPTSANMAVDTDVGVVRWMPSQSADPALRKLIAESEREDERERRPRPNASSYACTWAPSTSTSVTTRTASLPTFSAPSSNTRPSRAPSTSASTSSKKLPPRSIPLSKKLPPSRAYSATASSQDDLPLDPEQAAQLLHMLRDVSAKVDENSRLKQIARAKAEKKVVSATLMDITTRRNTVSSAPKSKFTSAPTTARPLARTASTSTISCASASAPPLGSAIHKTSSSTKPGTDTDVEMTIDSDRDTDLDCSILTSSLGEFTVTNALDESFSMHVDDIVPPPAKREFGRSHSAHTVSSTGRPTTSSSKALPTASSKFAASLEKMPQSTHVLPSLTPSTSQRRPPPLGMRRPPNIPNTRFPSSQSRYANTQTPYTPSQVKEQKQATLPRFKPPLLSKSIPKPVYTPRQVVQTPESPPTSTPELEKDDGDGDGEDESDMAGADSSFDVSFDVDADALEATMRQYD